jgi:hypothetical protein
MVLNVPEALPMSGGATDVKTALWAAGIDIAMPVPDRTRGIAICQ